MFLTHIKRSRASKPRSTRDRTEASVQLPFDSLGLPKEPLRLSKARRTLAPTRAVLGPLERMDGRINNDPSVRPSGRYAPLRTS